MTVELVRRGLRPEVDGGVPGVARAGDGGREGEEEGPTEAPGVRAGRHPALACGIWTGVVFERVSPTGTTGLPWGDSEGLGPA